MTQKGKNVFESFCKQRSFWHTFFGIISEKFDLKEINIFVLGKNIVLLFPLIVILRRSTRCLIKLRLYHNRYNIAGEGLNIYLYCIDKRKEKNFLDLNDLFNLGNWGMVEKSEIPRVFNTIENCFSKIGIVGQNKFSDKIYSYLKENSKIFVEKIDIANREDGIIVVKDEYDIVLIFDLNRYILKNIDGKRIYTYTVKDYYTAVGLDSELDIFQNIIPQIVSENVKVIGLYQDIDEEKYMKEILEKKSTSNEKMHKKQLYDILERESGGALLKN